MDRPHERLLDSRGLEAVKTLWQFDCTNLGRRQQHRSEKTWSTVKVPTLKQLDPFRELISIFNSRLPW